MVDKIFDYSFLCTDPYPASVVMLLGQIQEERLKLAVAWPTIASYEKSRLERYLIQYLRSSKALEKSIKTEMSLQSQLLSTEMPHRHRLSTKVRGYIDAVKIGINKDEKLPLNEESLLRLHEVLQSYDDPEGAGHYRTTPFRVQEVEMFYDENNASNKVSFMPSEPELIPEHVRRLMAAFLREREQLRENPLPLIACFLLDFIGIEPFIHGSGRLARVLAMTLVIRSGYTAPRYIPFEPYFISHVGETASAMSCSLDGWRENRTQYWPFVEVFLKIVLYCYREANNSVSKAAPAIKKKALYVEAVALAATEPFTMATLVQNIEGISRSTIENVIGALVREGKLEIRGNTRGSRYYPVPAKKK